jgi:hypothetical protein
MTKKKKHIFIIRHLPAKPTRPGVKLTRPGTEVNCHWSFFNRIEALASNIGPVILSLSNFAKL